MNVCVIGVRFLPLFAATCQFFIQPARLIGVINVAASHGGGSSSSMVSGKEPIGIASPNGCPRTCFCNSLSRIVYCSRRGLDAVPTTLPVGTLQLNLNGNRFKSIALLRANFSSSTLHATTIEHLYLSDCGIEIVQVGTFADLINLQWLDLSDNRLVIVPPRCFHGLSLQHLFLSGNRGVRLDQAAFVNSSVSGLYLHDCQLDDLPAVTVAPLNGTLVNLWLNGNRLTGIDRRLAELFAGLTHLRLGSNPLRCNCDTLWLKELYDRRGGAICRGAEQPTCSGPASVRGRHFGQLSATDFRCRAPAFGNIDTSFYPYDFTQNRTNGKSHGFLRCTATGEPTPTMYWIKPSGRLIRYDAVVSAEDSTDVNQYAKRVSQRQMTSQGHRQRGHSANVDDGRNEALLELISDDGEHTDVEAGMYICIATNDVGNVTLTVNLSWPLSAFRLPDGADRFALRRLNKGIKGYSPLENSSQSGFSPSSSDADALFAVINLADAIDGNNLKSNVNSALNGIVNNGHCDGEYLSVIDGKFTPEVSSVFDAETFSATEIAIAVVSTHFVTLLLLFVIVMATMPACRRQLMSSVAAKRPRRQHGANLPSRVAGTRDRNGLIHCEPSSSVLIAASTTETTYDADDPLLQSSSTPSRNLHDTSSRSTQDFCSTHGSRKFFWPPPATANCDYESS